MRVHTQPPVAAKTPWGVVLLAALPAALHAVLLLGRLHPDEVFQSLEPALHRAFGFGAACVRGCLTWEWQVGLRNTFVPIVFSWVLQLGAALGVTDVQARRALLELPQLALHAAMLGAVWRLAARRGTPRQAAWATWLTALYPPVLWFGGRTMSESFSVAFLVWGLERLDARDERPATAALAGLLLGLGELTRYGSAAVIFPALLWLAVTRRWKDLAFTCLGGGAVALFLGWLDFTSWGDWFHSLRAYVDFNVTSGRSAAQFGAQPAWYYLTRLAVAPWVPVGLWAWRKDVGGRAWLLLVCALGYFAAISATAHKEDRFLYPTLVLLTVAATPAFVRWVAERWAGAVGKGVGVVAVAAAAAFFVVPNAFAPAREEQFQLEVKASRGATGFLLVNDGLWGSGGWFYLGQNIPWCPCDWPADPCFQTAMRDPRFNRAVMWSNGPGEQAREAAAQAAFEQGGFRLAETRGQATLWVRGP